MDFQKLIFYNPFHNGDIHISRTFVSEICRHLGNGKEYFYSHRCHPAILEDLPWLKHEDQANRKMENQNNLHILGSTIGIGTWYGVNNYKYTNTCNGFNFDALYLLFQDVAKHFGFQLEDISKNPFHFFPKIEYRNLQIKNINQWLEKNRKINILICNNQALSGQAVNFNFTQIVLKLAASYRGFNFILTNKENDFDRQKFPNVLYSNEIIQKNNSSDLNEISYLSLKCPLIIGRASGPFTFAFCQENVSAKGKTLLTFSSLGPASAGSFWLGEWGKKQIKYQANVIQSPETDLSKVENLIIEHINRL